MQLTASNTNLEYFDGFDDYNTAQIPRYWNSAVMLANPPLFSSFHSSITISSSTGRNNSSSLRFQANSGQALYLSCCNGSVATRTVGIALKASCFTDSNYGNFVPIAFFDGAYGQVGLLIHSTGTLSVVRINTNGSLTVILGPSTQSLNFNIYYYIEFSATIHPTAGSAIAKVNGITWLTGSSLNTRTTSSSTCNGVSIGGIGLQYGNATIADFDDIYIRSDSTFMGDQRIESRFPSANGFSNNWTPLSGSNFQNVDESIATDDTDYNFSSAVNDTDLFTYPSLASLAGTVSAVMLVPILRVDTNGVATLCSIYRQSSVNYLGTTQGVGSTTYAAYPDIQGQDPSTSSPWTIASVNSAQFGIRRLT